MQWCASSPGSVWAEPRRPPKRLSRPWQWAAFSPAESSSAPFCSQSCAAGKDSRHNDHGYGNGYKVDINWLASILTQELQQKIQEEAGKISPEGVEKYYKEHADSYEQFNLDRLFVPRKKQPDADAKLEDEKNDKLSEEAQKATKAVVFGLLVAFFVVTAVLMLAIALFRVLVVLTGEVWAAYLILGGIFVAAGAFVWTLRSPRNEDANA